MKTYIEERAVEVAKFMITTNATVRETAKKFGISKSTVHTVFPIGVGCIG
ncbi:MAG: sporulation transcriptional regulator SpoIIID [Anaerotignum sp.]|nr:sporulation transcriptional regulator SpoIIID [Anaerotignum sp.]